jgi:hypothetical protein
MTRSLGATQALRGKKLGQASRSRKQWATLSDRGEP